MLGSLLEPDCGPSSFFANAMMRLVPGPAIPVRTLMAVILTPFDAIAGNKKEKQIPEETIGVTGPRKND